MTKQLRERFEKTFFYSDYDLESVWSFIEQEIIEAERRGREEMRKECLTIIPTINTNTCLDYTVGYSEACKDIKSAISSLK